MMVSRGLILSALVLSIAFAGCASSSGNQAPPADSPQSSVAAQPGDVPDAGQISGFVVDDSQAPIAGATVGLKAPSVQVTTDAAGSFLITNLAPGTYEVHAARLGFVAAGKSVVVTASETAAVTFQLTPLVLDEVRQEFFGPYNGFLVCGFVRPGVSGTLGTTTYDCGTAPDAAAGYVGQRANSFRFKMSQDNIVAAVGETKWQSSTAGTSTKLQTFFQHSASTGTHWWCSSSGNTPTRFVWSENETARECFDKGSATADPVPTKKLNLQMAVYLPFCRFNTASPTDVPLCVTLQQSYKAVATVFYGDLPSPGYSGFQDG